MIINMTHFIEKRGWLVGQARMRVDDPAATTTCFPTPVAPVPCCEGTASSPIPHGTTTVATLSEGRLPHEPEASPSKPTLSQWLRLSLLGRNLWAIARRLVLFFTGFVLLGYLIIELVPNHIFQTYLGQSSNFAVPLSAALGIPFYISSDASLPLIASLVSSGMGEGPALAFLVTGAGTSIGAIAGSLVIARRRVVGLVIAFLFVGAVILGELGRIIL